MNFARDVVDAAPGADRALVEIDAAGARREWTFAEVSDVSARLAGTFVARGVRRGDVVMTLIGSRPQWVLSMVACFRIGAAVCFVALAPISDPSLVATAIASALGVQEVPNRSLLETLVALSQEQIAAVDSRQLRARHYRRLRSLPRRC